MKRYRIGNDIHCEWSVLKDDGTAYDLTGLKLRLWMQASGLETEIVDFTVEHNVISWVFPGKDQSRIGVYRAVLCQNQGELGMATIDVEDAVELVARTAAEGGYDSTRIKTSSALSIKTGYTEEENEKIRKEFKLRMKILQTLMGMEELREDMDIVVASEDEISALAESSGLDENKIYLGYENDEE